MPRKLEALAVFLTLVAINCSPFFGVSLFLYCLIYGHISRYLVIAYQLYVFYQCKFNDGVGKHKPWFSSSSFHKLASSYYPMTMTATAEVPKDRNYIISLHPHGWLSLFITNYFFHSSKSFKKLFGNNPVKVCVAPFNFWLPLLRLWYRNIGAISASETSIMRNLSSKKSGVNLALIVGGAEEAILLTPTEHRLFLKKRKGFCRIALKTGTHLIPAYVFGENLLWDTVQPKPGTFLYKYQHFLLNYLHIGLPILKGSFMPRRLPVTIVHGKPITVKKVENPTREEVDALHAKYIQELIKLFEANKEKFLHDKSVHLVIE